MRCICYINIPSRSIYLCTCTHTHNPHKHTCIYRYKQRIAIPITNCPKNLIIIACLCASIQTHQQEHKRHLNTHANTLHGTCSQESSQENSTTQHLLAVLCYPCPHKLITLLFSTGALRLSLSHERDPLHVSPRHRKCSLEL